MVATTDWAYDNFGSCELGDKRRTERLVRVASQVVNNPSASFPNQMRNWSDLKAAYNLFDREEVTFEAVARPHWERTKQRKSGCFLVIGDTTEVNFGGLPENPWVKTTIFDCGEKGGAPRESEQQSLMFVEVV